MKKVTNVGTAQSLLSKSIFLLGAGATRDAGCFVSSEMLDDIYTMHMEPPEKAALDFLLSSLEYHASWKNLKEGLGFNSTTGHQSNIEDLMLLIRRIVNRDSYLPFPITGSWADKINFLEIEWRATKTFQELGIKKNLFEYLEHKITARLPNWLNLGHENTDYLKPIDDYFRNSSRGLKPLDFFTLNYDLVFEKHFNSNDETLMNTGFSNGQYIGFFQSSASSDTRINYYKLHGSINWKKTESGQIKDDFEYRNVTIQPTGNGEDALDQDSNQDLYDNSAMGPHIIFGQGGKFLSVDPFISLLYEFKSKLKDAELIFVIGYSFFDPYINNLLLEGITGDSQETKLMIVVNPRFKSTISDGKNSAEVQAEQKRNFIDYIKLVQKSTYLSELPSFNLTEIAPNRIKVVGLTTGEFVSQYFSPSESGFLDLKEELERIGSEGDIF